MKRILTISLATLIIGGASGYYYLYSVNEQSERITPRQHHTATAVQTKSDDQIIREFFRNKFPQASISSITTGYYGGTTEVLMDFEANGLKRFVVKVEDGKISYFKVVE